MKTINLAYALKTKSRLNKKVAAAKREIDSVNNVYVRDSERTKDLPDLLEKYDGLREKYAAISVIINTANVKSGITKLIADLDMYRAKVNIWESLDTNTPDFCMTNHVTGETTYIPRKTQISADEVKEAIMSLVRRIDELQDKIDMINGTFQIEIDEALLEF